MLTSFLMRTKPKASRPPLRRRKEGERTHIERFKQLPANWTEFLRIYYNITNVFHLYSERVTARLSISGQGGDDTWKEGILLRSH